MVANQSPTKSLNNRPNVRPAPPIKPSNAVAEAPSNTYATFKLNITMAVNLSSFGI